MLSELLGLVGDAESTQRLLNDYRDFLLEPIIDDEAPLVCSSTVRKVCKKLSIVAVVSCIHSLTPNLSLARSQTQSILRE